MKVDRKSRGRDVNKHPLTSGEISRQQDLKDETLSLLCDQNVSISTVLD